MGKNKRAAKAAWRAAAAAATTPPAATTSPTLPLDMHAAASDVGELHARTPQQPRESQTAPAPAAHPPSPPAPSLVTEPASPIADATPASAVEDASNAHDEHARNACAETREHEPAPARASTTGVQHEPLAVSMTPPPIRHDTLAPHTHPTPPLTRPTPAAAAIAVLAACIHAAGPPDFVVTTPTYAFDDACAGLPAASNSTTSPTPTPAMHAHDPPPCLATTREEIHPDLLAMIMEDGRRIERRAARLQPIDEEWKVAYQQGWHEGYEAGLDDGYSEVSPPPTTVRTDVGTQSDDPAPPLPTPASPHPSTSRVDAAVQANTPPSPPRMRADLHISSHASLAPNVAVAVVQTDDAIVPARVGSASQTADPAGTPRRSMLDSVTPPHVNGAIPADLPSPTPTIAHSTHTPTCTVISTSPDAILPSHDSFTTPTNNDLTAHTIPTRFSWADDAAKLPVNNVTPLASLPTRDFSVLRTPPSRPPFESLQRRARRSRTRPAHLTRLQPPPPPQPPSRPLPVITRCHPSGLRTGRPSVTIRSSPAPTPMVPHTAPLDWDADPRLCELSRVLQGLGGVRSGSG